MVKQKHLFLGLLMVVGCAADNKTDIGDATVGTNTFHIFREGPAADDGVMTTLVLKATAGAMPTAIVAWVGLDSAEASTKVSAVFDSGDGDFDVDITCPSPMPLDSKFWFSVTTGGQLTTGSIALK